MKINQFIIYIAASLLFGQLSAQNDLLRVQNFGIEDGLSQRDIYKIQQDDQGFMWVVTKNGLDRYDGHNFYHWLEGDEKNYLPNGISYDCIIDQNRAIWHARGNVLIKSDPLSGQTDTIDILTERHSNSWINQLAQDEAGTIWTTRFNATDTTNWLVSSDENGLLQDMTKLPGQYTNRPIAHYNKQLYIGAFENEIWVLDLDGKQVQQFEFPIPSSDKKHSRVIQLKANNDGTIWAMLDHGQLYYLPANAKSFIRHPISDNNASNFHTSAFLVQQNGDVWMGGLVSSDDNEDTDGSPCTSFQPGAALLHYSSMSQRIEDYSYFLKQALPYAEAPRQIFQDQTGVVWIATPFGLIRMVENNLFERLMSDGNDCCRDGVCSMRGITEDERGNIYFSYYSSIHVYNPRNGSLMPMFSEQLGYPYGILYDKGHIYTGEGLRVNLKSLEVDTIAYGLSDAEGVLMKDQGGMIWFGCKDKIIQFNPTTNSTTTFEDPTGQLADANFENITHLHPASATDHFWMATREKGIFKIHTTKGVVAHWHDASEPALAHNRILAVRENNQQLWIASAAGLGRLDLATDSVEFFTKKDGLDNDFINGLLTEGDSAVWVSTDNGLSRLDIKRRSFSNFFHADGLSNNEFNRMSFHQSKDGRMYFGGIDGINAFYPNARYGKRKTKMNSQLLLTQFNKFDGHKDIKKVAGILDENEETPLSLSHQDQTFTFHYALADFTDPKTHLYSYMLEGYSDEWSEPTPLHFARFVNIPAGNYIFRAKAARSKGDWVKNELAVPVVIQQAFYKTGWFKIFSIGFFSLLIYGMMQYRLEMVRKHEQELELLVQERTRELASEKAKSDDLLLNILPAETAEELKQFGVAKARRHDEVTVFFSDFKGFSFVSQELEPEELVAEIDYCFSAFDKIIEEFGLEKIKTVGDAYLCGGGFNEMDEKEGAIRVVQAALKIQEFLGQYATERRAENRPFFEARIGIHTGPVVSGIVGIKKFAYDIWGDTVNISERLQSGGEVGKVNISKTTYELVNDQFDCIHRGKVVAKHQGEIDMYFVS